MRSEIGQRVCCGDFKLHVLRSQFLVFQFKTFDCRSEKIGAHAAFSLKSCSAVTPMTLSMIDETSSRTALNAF